MNYSAIQRIPWNKLNKVEWYTKYPAVVVNPQIHVYVKREDTVDKGRKNTTDLRLGNISRSAVAEHAVLNDHLIRWGKCQILCRAKKPPKHDKVGIVGNQQVNAIYEQRQKKFE